MKSATTLREESALRLARLDDVVPQPWRNGGGRTRELLVWPESPAWNVRVSVADVESDGPFSVFAGVQRWFAVLEGEGVELTIDGRAQPIVHGSAPVAFAGAADTSCRLLGGPTRDLNLMLRHVPGRMLAASGKSPWRPALAHCGIYALVAGRCLADDAATDLPARALLWFDRAPASLSFEAATPASGSVAWWLEAGDPGDDA